MFDFTRVVLNKKVYLLVDEICQLLEISEEKLFSEAGNTFVVGPGNSNLLAESDYNNMLLHNADWLQKNGGHEEITKISSLRAKFNNQKHLLPLKQIFFPQLDVQTELAQNLRQAKKEINNESISTQYYEKELAILNNSEYFDRELLKQNELDIQVFSELNTETGSVGLSAYLVGKNVFYSLFLDESNDENWLELKRNEKGDIFIQRLNSQYEFKEEKIPIYDCNRDFREHSILENLAWCIMNMPLKNEWQDEVNCESGTIHFNLKLPLLVKIFNPNSFKEIQLIAGFIKFK